MSSVADDKKPEAQEVILYPTVLRCNNTSLDFPVIYASDSLFHFLKHVPEWSIFCEDLIQLVIEYASDNDLVIGFSDCVRKVAEIQHAKHKCSNPCLWVVQYDRKDCQELEDYSKNWAPSPDVPLTEYLLSLDYVFGLWNHHCQPKTAIVFLVQKSFESFFSSYPLSNLCPVGIQNSCFKEIFSLLLHYPFLDLAFSPRNFYILENMLITLIRTLGLLVLDHYLGPAMQNFLLNCLRSRTSHSFFLSTYYFDSTQLPWYPNSLADLIPCNLDHESPHYVMNYVLNYIRTSSKFSRPDYDFEEQICSILKYFNLVRK